MNSKASNLASNKRGHDKSKKDKRLTQANDLLEKTRILKFKNEEAYLYGDTQLIYFTDIRE